MLKLISQNLVLGGFCAFIGKRSGMKNKSVQTIRLFDILCSLAVIIADSDYTNAYLRG